MDTTMDTTDAANTNLISNYSIDSEPDLSDDDMIVPFELSDIQFTEQEVLDQFQILDITK